ncbi:LicD family protein, partial [bacterium]|nr:LicD family protein [bacterium]
RKDVKKWFVQYRIFGFKLNVYESKRRIKALEEEVACLRNVLSAAVDLHKLHPATGAERKKQLQCLDVFQTVIKVIERHHLSYFISFGSLLGAVRHKGFIPWDDDIDITMLREDYLKLIPLLKAEFAGSDYVVREAWDNHYQIRICRKTNVKIGMDIFPMDKYSQSDISKQEKKLLNLSLRNGMDKLKHYEHIGEMDVIREHIKDITDNIIGTGNSDIDRPALFYAIDYPHNHDNLVFDYDDIFPLQNVEFEGIKVKAPHNMDRYLKTLYGEYDKLPAKASYE